LSKGVTHGVVCASLLQCTACMQYVAICGESNDEYANVAVAIHAHVFNLAF